MDITDELRRRFEELKKDYLTDVRQMYYEERAARIKEFDRNVGRMGYPLAKKIYDYMTWEAEQKYHQAELRFNPNHGKDGKFTSGKDLTSNGKGVKMSYKERKRVSSQIATDFPDLKADGKMHYYENRNHSYKFTVNEFGSYNFLQRMKIAGNEDKINKLKKGGK